MKDRKGVRRRQVIQGRIINYGDHLALMSRRHVVALLWPDELSLPDRRDNYDVRFNVAALAQEVEALKNKHS